MPAYSFQQRFVPFVVEGSKQQTIRSRRRYPAKAGDTLFLYSGLRTKWSKKLCEQICTDTRTIMITEEGNILLFRKRLATIPGKLNELYKNKFDLLNEEQRNLLAWLDGFRPDGSTVDHNAGCFDIMFRWFRSTHMLPFIGDIIYWNASENEMLHPVTSATIKDLTKIPQSHRCSSRSLKFFDFVKNTVKKALFCVLADLKTLLQLLQFIFYFNESISSTEFSSVTRSQKPP